MNVLVAMGTLHEIVKLVPLVHVLRRRGFEVRVVSMSSRESDSLGTMFLDRFGVSPDTAWDAETEEPKHLPQILELAIREVIRHRPDCLLVTGDADTVPLFGLAARRYGVPVVHVEAGLRSFDDLAIEDVNQRIAGQIAKLHLAPTKMAARFLRLEGIDDDRIHVVGNPVFDALRLVGVRRRPPSNRSGILVDSQRTGPLGAVELRPRMIELVLKLAELFGSVTFPVTESTRSGLIESGDWRRLQTSSVRLFPRLPFDGMVELVATSRVVVCDSREVQEQAAWLGVPAVVLRSSTPDWEGVAAGIATLTGLDLNRSVEAVRRFTSDEEQARVAAECCPYGDGQTAQRIADIMLRPETQDLLAAPQPDFIGRDVDVTTTGELLVH